MIKVRRVVEELLKMDQELEFVVSGDDFGPAYEIIDFEHGEHLPFLSTMPLHKIFEFGPEASPRFEVCFAAPGANEGEKEAACYFCREYGTDNLTTVVSIS